MMHYLSLFTLFGSLLAFVVCVKLLIQKRLNAASAPLAIIVVLLSLRAYRDFQVFTPNDGISTLEFWIYHLSAATLLLPYLTYLWLVRRTGEDKKWNWAALWPYTYQVLLASINLWYEPFFGVVSEQGNTFLMFLGDFLSIGLCIYYGSLWLARKQTLGHEEKVVVGSLLVSVSVVFLYKFLLTLNFNLSLGLDWQPIYITYMLIKSLLIFAMTYVLHQLYGGKTLKVVSRPRTSAVTVNPILVETFLEKKMHLDHDVTVLLAAKELGVSKHVLSKTISELGAKNFVEFVNEHRLNHFLSMVEEKAYLKLSIMGMAETSGFKSKATFNRVFKAKLGLTPSVYIEQYGNGVAHEPAVEYASR